MVETTQIARTGAVIVVVVLLVWQVAALPSHAGMEEYIEESSEWCESRDGELYHSNTIGEHGGLHCELPEGETVHMSEVIDRQAGVKYA